MRAAACFVVSFVAAVALAVVYWEGGQPQAEGVLLAVALGGIGVGHRAVGQALHARRRGGGGAPRRWPPTEEEVAAFAADFEAGESTLRSRRILVATAGGACAALGVALLFPIRSLGPRPGRGPEGDGRSAAAASAWSREDGAPVRPDDLEVDGVHHRLPRGPHRRRRRADPAHPLPRRPGRSRPGPAGRTGRSTTSSPTRRSAPTSGCPVGLYQAELGPAAVPVPPVDVRRARRGPAGVRPGGPVAAAAPARRSTTTATSSPTGDFSEPDGPRLLGPGPVSAR